MKKLVGNSIAYKILLGIQLILLALTLLKICNASDCDTADIMEFVRDESVISDTVENIITDEVPSVR